jgi:HTH-type transcriptional regulator/antitoxin HigA
VTHDHRTTGHPGTILREVLQVRGLTQAALARMLRRPAQAVSEIVGGKKAITADTALDLQEAFGISAEFWVHAQAEHDLWSARCRRTAGDATTAPSTPNPRT